MKIPTPLLLGLIALVGVACASTGVDKSVAKAKVAKTKKPSASSQARTMVRAVLIALRGGDEAGFKNHLSKTRLAAYDRAYFDLWAKEVGAFSSAYPSGWELSKGGVTGTVTVTVSGRQRASVGVRVRLEDGLWRWDER